MKRRVILGLVLAAVIVVSMVAVFGTVAVKPVDSTTLSAGNPCLSDSDCTGNRICCPISRTCTTPRGCRKDPLH